MPISPASPLFWLLLAGLLWPVLWVSVLLHEAGHALAGKLAGYHVAAWGLGDGEPLLLVPSASRPTRTRFFVCRRSPFSGYTGAIFPGLLPTRGQAIAFVLGGPTANLLLAVAGLGVLGANGGGINVVLGLLLIGVNALLCLMALAPGRAGGLPTDGMRLTGLLGVRPAHVPAASPQAILDQADLWRRLHAPTLVQFSLLSAAVAAAQIGDTTTARTCLNEAVALPDLDAYARLAQGVHLETAGNAERTREAFRQARTAYQAAGHRAAARMTHIYEAGDDADALNDLYLGTLTQQFPCLRTLAAARYLLAVCADGATPALATALSRYQTARLAWRSDTQDAHVFAVAAQILLRDGDTAGAHVLREQAQRAAKQVEYALADDPDALAAFRQRIVFLSNHSPATFANSSSA